jgi:hypothetical protein
VSHQNALVRIISAYAPGTVVTPVMLSALETYISSVVEKAVDEAKQEIGNTVCEHLHDGPSLGVVCLTCIDAEKNAPGLMELLAEQQFLKHKSENPGC